MNAIASGFESQLDQLKVITLTDGEVWSARDLMPFAGYADWRNWTKAINRAVASVNASGLNAADHFVGVTKMIETGKSARREVEDVELTRYACYILFQNADGAKPEVAAAQQYFAIQTRKQEVAPTLTEDEIVAQALSITTNRVKALEAKVTELEPKADAWDGLASGTGTYAVADAAKMLNQVGIVTGRDRLFQFMHELGWVYRQSGRWQAKQTAVDTGRLYHKPQSHKHPETGETVLDAPQVRVTMKGVEQLRIAMLEPVAALEGVGA